MTVHEYARDSLVDAVEDGRSHGDVFDEMTAIREVRICGGKGGKVARPSMISGGESRGEYAIPWEGGEGWRTHVNPFRAVMHHSLNLVGEVSKVRGEHAGGDDGAWSRHRSNERRIWSNGRAVSPFCLPQNGNCSAPSSLPAQRSR